MSEDLDFGLFPREVIDAYNKELDAADEADEIAVKIVIGLDYGDLETTRSPGIPTVTSDRPTRPIRPIALRKLAAANK